MTYDLIIIGSGPAGLSAAIYAARAELNFVIVEREGATGGQVLLSYEIDNYPGFPHVTGSDLASAMRRHCEELGCKFVSCEVEDITRSKNKTYTVRCEDGTELVSRSVLACTGASHRKLNIPGEEELAGSGVSYCATCDGSFFKGKTVAVIGGGDTALEDALYLSRICEKVYLVHRRDTLRAALSLVSAAKRAQNIEFCYNSIPDKISGEDSVESLTIKSVKSGKETVLPVNGVFVAIGMEPCSGIFSQIAECNKEGFIITGADCSTAMPGFYAAGDVRTKDLRQIVTAVSDGAVAVTSIVRFLSE